MVKHSPIQEASRFLFSGYAHEHRPLGAYAGLAFAFNALLAGSLVAGGAAGRRIPERIGPGDILLLGMATHKLSRLIARDWVTSFLRAPFTHFEGPSELPAEVSEEPRGRGLRRALGELLTCPFCVGQWVAGGFACGLVLKPSLSRFLASLFAVLAVSDFLHFAYVVAEQQTESEDEDEPDKANE